MGFVHGEQVRYIYLTCSTSVAPAKSFTWTEKVYIPSQCTGGNQEMVREAAHSPASNHVQNGWLLTKEFHALFDAGYVTVTPETKSASADACARR